MDKRCNCQPSKKRAKHSKSFAFYRNNDQIYEKALASALFSDLGKLLKKDIIKDVKLHDNQLTITHSHLINTLQISLNSAQKFPNTFLTVVGEMGSILSV